MEFRVIGLAHGPLLGFQYLDKMAEEDFNEFNIYLLLVCLSWKWY